MASTSTNVGDWLSSGASSEPLAFPSTQSCGLFVADDSNKPLPLRCRTVNARVYAEHGFTEVQEQLAYVADEDCTVRFVFPLPPRSAVFKFTATIGDRQVVTQVKRKQAAQDEYDDAVRQGHTAIHMQQQPGASLYSVDVGNLFAMEEALITFSYVRMLNSVAGALEFEHQATWVPPYLKAEERDAAGNATDDVARATPVFAAKVSYTLSYHITVQSSRGFKSIESPSPVSLSEEGCDVRIVRQDATVSDPSQDFTLLIELPALSESQSHTGQLLVQECARQGDSKTKTVALASFIPRLPKPEQLTPQACEIIFVVDGSGSMGGSPIAQALQAALFFVQDLPAYDLITFNAAMFGSSHQMMWPASRKYDTASQRDAMQWLQHHVNANWGGTEVLQLLRFIYESMPLAEGTSRQILFLTDGGVSGHEEESIFQLVEGKSGTAAAKAAAARTTIFSLGIGHGVHRGLVEGVAHKTGGMAQFVVDEEPIGRKAGLLKRAALAAGSGCLTKPRLVSRSCMVKAAPNVLPPRLFPDEPLHVLVEVLKQEAGASLDLTAVVPGAAGEEERTHSISLPLDTAVRVPGDVFAVLHAMSSIGGLLAGTSALHCNSGGQPHARQPSAQQVEDAVVALAVEEGLVTKHTSAVGVLLQRDPLDPARVTEVQVPLQLPAGRELWRSRSQQQQQQQCAPGAAYTARCAMAVNIDAVLARGEKLQVLCDKSAELQGQAHMFRRAARPLKAGGMAGVLSSLASNLFGKRQAAAACAAPPPASPPAYRECRATCSARFACPESGEEGGGAEGEDACSSSSTLASMPECRGVPLSAPVPMTPMAVLALLNLHRAVHGAVLASPEVLQALAGQVTQQQGESAAPAAATLLAAAARPAALTSDDAWVTVLALAYLRKHLAAEQSVWSGLEAKALEWLGTVWPPAVGRSVGSVVLAAMKLV